MTIHIQKLLPDRLQDVYDIRCQALLPWPGVAAPPFGAVWGLVEPGGATKLHNHYERETFFIARGRGVVLVGEEQAEVEAGDVIYFASFGDHTLKNASGSEDILFLSVYWEDRASLPTAERTPGAAPGGRVLVTAAPPTPNGDLHLGHLSGPYLAGDIQTRYLRQRGLDVRYACGTDDNQSYVPLAAAQRGSTPGETADLLAGDIQRTLAAARVEMDLFVRPNASRHHAPMAQAFCRALHERGALIEREAPSPYCHTCERYLFEAHIRGGCPHCGALTGGNSCEDCGRPNDCIDLVDPSCTGCGGTPSPRTFRRLYFPLGRYARELAAYHRSVAMAPGLRSLCEQVLAEGLPDIAVTHPAAWGIPAPIEGFEGQRLYAWFEMAPRYLAYAEALAEEQGGWQAFFKAEGARIIQCFGFDNGFFYAVFLPALYLAFDPEIRLPAAFVMNEFYRLDGLKFSTSRRHAIWGRELMPAVPADMVRFYLAKTAPETEGTSFTLGDFEAEIQRELCGAWQAWLHDLGAKVRRDAGGRVPATGDWTAEHRRFYARLCQLAAEAAGAYEASTFSPQRAAAALSTLVREARRFGKAEDGWRRVARRGEERRTGIALELLAARSLAMMAAPILPDFAARLLRELGYGDVTLAARWEEQPEWVPAGQRVGDLDAPFFPDVRDAIAAAGARAG